MRAAKQQCMMAQGKGRVVEVQCEVRSGKVGGSQTGVAGLVVAPVADLEAEPERQVSSRGSASFDFATRFIFLFLVLHFLLLRRRGCR